MDGGRSRPSWPCFAAELFDVRPWGHRNSLRLYRNPDTVANQVGLKLLGAAVELVKC